MGEYRLKMGEYRLKTISPSYKLRSMNRRRISNVAKPDFAYIFLLMHVGSGHRANACTPLLPDIACPRRRNEVILRSLKIAETAVEFGGHGVTLARHSHESNRLRLINRKLKLGKCLMVVSLCERKLSCKADRSSLMCGPITSGRRVQNFGKEPLRFIESLEAYESGDANLLRGKRIPGIRHGQTYRQRLLKVRERLIECFSLYKTAAKNGQQSYLSPDITRTFRSGHCCSGGLACGLDISVVESDHTKLTQRPIAPLGVSELPRDSMHLLPVLSHCRSIGFRIDVALDDQGEKAEALVCLKILVFLEIDPELV